MSKKIIICADDFAQNHEITEGILLLAKDKRISAISCMVNGACWDEAWRELSAINFKGYIGLHLNLTFGQPLSSVWRKFEGEQFYPLPILLKKLYFKQIKSATIEAEIQAQLDVFSNLSQTYPDFIDGHQHVHQFTTIREVLLKVHHKVRDYPDEEEYNDAFFRNTSNGFKDFTTILGFPKPQVLSMLGAKKFRKILTIKQIPTNASFTGIYNFNNAHNYRRYFKKFLNRSKNGGIVMCHPGSYSKDLSDPLHKYRHYELTYLLSDFFLTDMEDSHNSLAFKR